MPWLDWPVVAEVRAQPRGLHRPLTGGSPGATVTVEPLLAAEILCPPGFLESASGPRKWQAYAGVGIPRSRWHWIPVPVFLIRHPTAGPILVDTGLHPSVVADPKHSLGPVMGRLQQVRMDADQAIARQLRDRGIKFSDVPYVLMTHLHYDHASGISEFPESTFVVSEAEWTAATTVKRPILHGYRQEQFDYAFEYRTIDLTRGSVSSYSTFGRTFDLFADGTIRLAFTPGHSAGHCSIICRLGDRDLIIAGDAVYTMRQLEGTTEPPRPEDMHRWRRSAAELRRFREQHPDAVIIAGHDREQWPTLEERYA